MKQFKKIGMVGRFKPLNLGGAKMLEHACKNAEHVLIGIGSCNRYNARTPFTAYETREMINAFLSPTFNNYSFVNIPDFGHLVEYSDGKKWKETMVNAFAGTEVFFSGNPYVVNLLKDDFVVRHSATLIPKEEWIRINSTTVRLKMAEYGDWQSLVPSAVAKYIEDHELDIRFRNRFGLETLAELANLQDDELMREPNSEIEKNLVGGVK